MNNSVIILKSMNNTKDKKEEKTLESNDNARNLIKLTDVNNKKKESIKLIQKITSKKGKKKFYTNQNSSNFFLKENNNLNIIKNDFKKGNNSFIDVYKKFDLNNLNDNKKNSIGKIIRLSRGSIAKIEHKKRKLKDLLDENLKEIIYFSFFDFLKSVIFRKRKDNHNFITIFRKHLLSEEHLLKSHIKMIFLEKNSNFNGKENSNALECFNEL